MAETEGNIMDNEMFKVIYQSPTNKSWSLSDDMDFDAACKFRDKCLNMGYDSAFVIKVID